MDSIWSYIIWEKLGFSHETYKINEEPFERSKELVVDYLESLEIKEFEECLTHLSASLFIPETDYYDGHFHQISQDGTSEPNEENLIIHDTSFFPFIINLCCHFDIQDNEFEMLKEIVTIYRKKREDEIDRRENEVASQN